MNIGATPIDIELQTRRALPETSSPPADIAHAAPALAPFSTSALRAFAAERPRAAALLGGSGTLASLGGVGMATFAIVSDAVSGGAKVSVVISSLTLAASGAFALGGLVHQVRNFASGTAATV